MNLMNRIDSSQIFDLSYKLTKHRPLLGASASFYFKLLCAICNFDYEGVLHLEDSLLASLRKKAPAVSIDLANRTLN